MANKPSKPRPDFPLFAHSNGQWAKKKDGKLHYFGPWDDPTGAEQRYLDWSGADATTAATTDEESAQRIPAHDRPAKPRPDFPLYPHKSGQWAVKVRGKMHYCGPWRDDRKGVEALAYWNRIKDYVLAGEEPPEPTDGLTVGDLVNKFLHARKGDVESGDLEHRTWKDYEAIGKRMIGVWGRGKAVLALKPEDFRKLKDDFQKTHDCTTLVSDINRTRVFFNYAVEMKWLPHHPDYGRHFDKPTAKMIRRTRRKKAKKLLRSEQIRTLLELATVPMKAMILLGANCALGNADCMHLEKCQLDLQRGWLNYPRRKTEIDRRCPLWPETIEALKAVLAMSRKATNPEDDKYVFITKYGMPWKPKSVRDNPVTKEFRKLLDEAGYHEKGVGFYSLRHTFRTVGGKTKDRAAVEAIMGHAKPQTDMWEWYDEDRLNDPQPFDDFEDKQIVSDNRLKAVTDFVRGWLFRRTEESTPAE